MICLYQIHAKRHVHGKFHVKKSRLSTFTPIGGGNAQFNCYSQQSYNTTEGVVASVKAGGELNVDLTRISLESTVLGVQTWT